MMPRRRRGRTLDIDGRTLEGGGQLVRNALCLSALTGIAIRITDIRGRRSGGGGLKAQHLSCVKWLAHACAADVEGAELKSRSLVFQPDVSQWERQSPAYTKKTLPGGRKWFQCTMDIGTAGSTSLALQAILPYLLFSPTRPQSADSFIRLHMSGGTNVSNSPSYEYITQVLLPTLHNIGLPEITAALERRGWADSRGSLGSFTLYIPVIPDFKLKAFQLAPSQEQTHPHKPSKIVATFIGPRACHPQLQAILPDALGRQFSDAIPTTSDGIEIVCEDSKQDKRLYLILVAIVSTLPEDRIPEYRLSSDWLYDRKVRQVERSVDEMVERVVHGLYDEWKSGAWVDEHMQDQLVIFQALAKGESRVWPGRDHKGELREPSLHAQTAQWIAESLLKREGDVAAITEHVEDLELD